MLTTARKALAICGAVALLGGGLAGMGLANYAQSGAFEFYKNTPPPSTASAMTATSDSAGYYPISRAAATPAYPEDPYPPRVTIARPAQPADYRRAAADIDPPAPTEEQAALSGPDPEPVIAPQRGSWSAPDAGGDSPAEVQPGDRAS